MKNIQRYYRDIILLCCIIVIIVGFFYPLFYPSPRLFFTPDHDSSDVSHFNIPFKHFLSESLKAHSLPLWSDAIGEGFPVLAQGEVGTFAITNLVLYTIFPFVTAFNLTYVTIFIMFAIGMYLVARELSLSRLVAFFCGSIFAFTGFHIVQIPHLNHLQTFSYFPFLFWIWLRMLHHPTSLIWLLAPFVFSQQIFAGHFQYVYMEAIFFFLFIAFSFKQYKKQYASLWFKFIAVILVTILLSAIQLFPTYEFFSLSNRNRYLLSFGSSSYTFGLSIKEFIRALNPYILGDIRVGSFVDIYSESYWETLFYIGIIPLLLFLLSLRLARNISFVRVFLLIFPILLVLSMDMKSPLYVLFSFPPFSWFRIQSRFVAYMSFLAVLLSGLSLEALTKRIRNNTVRMCVLLAFVSISVFELFQFGRSYNPTLDARRILDMPEFLTNINVTWPYRMHAVRSDRYWRKQLYKYGWENIDNYLYLLNHGTPNYPMIGHIPSLTVYSGISLKKQSYFESLLEVSIKNPNKQASLSASAINTFQLHAVKDIVTSALLSNKDVTLVSSTIPPSADLPVFYHYVIHSVKPIYYMAHKIAPANSYDEFTEYMKNPNFITTYDAVITGVIQTQLALSPPHDDIQVLSKEPTDYSYRIQNETDGYFVQSTLYYPGWKAYLDGKLTEIYPANLTGMSVYLPKGLHTLTFTFEPTSLWMGMTVSTIGILMYAILIIVYAKSRYSSPPDIRARYPRHHEL